MPPSFHVVFATVFHVSRGAGSPFASVGFVLSNDQRAADRDIIVLEDAMVDIAEDEGRVYKPFMHWRVKAGNPAWDVDHLFFVRIKHRAFMHVGATPVGTDMVVTFTLEPTVDPDGALRLNATGMMRPVGVPATARLAPVRATHAANRSSDPECGAHQAMKDAGYPGDDVLEPFDQDA